MIELNYINYAQNSKLFAVSFRTSYGDTGILNKIRELTDHEFMTKLMFMSNPINLLSDFYEDAINDLQ